MKSTALSSRLASDPLGINSAFELGRVVHSLRLLTYFLSLLPRKLLKKHISTRINLPMITMYPYRVKSVTIGKPLLLSSLSIHTSGFLCNSVNPFSAVSYVGVWLLVLLHDFSLCSEAGVFLSTGCLVFP